MWKRTVFGVMLLLLSPGLVWSFEVYRKDDLSLSVGFWGDAWFQHVTDYEDREGDGSLDNLNDFMVRRAYFSISGTVNRYVDFFVHFSGDRLGQEDLDNSSKGLGSGLAVRDAWVNFKIPNDDFMVQVGRMYVPLTRNYGTTSTKTLLCLELDWGQGGTRSGIFYPSNVARDDSVTFWGNILEDKLQYRFMIGDGEEDNAKNPDDNLRFAGRLSYNFFDTETKWFNAGTYRGKKHILAVGLGGDTQQDLVWNGQKNDYAAWTVDLHYDQPIGRDALTAAAHFINVQNSANGVTWTDIKAGQDFRTVNLKAGYYFGKKIWAGNLQPFVHYDAFDAKENGKKDTDVYGLGLNYYLKGPANKVSLDLTFVDQDKESDDNSRKDHTILTCQVAFGF